MTDDRRDQISHRLSRASDASAAAEVLLNADYTSGPIGEMYYACFHAVRALLVAEGLSSKRHNGTRALFVTHWIQPGLLAREMSRFYGLMSERNRRAEWEPFVQFERADVEAWLVDTRSFVAQVSDWLQANVPDLKPAP